MAVVQELTERYADRPGKGFVKNKIASRISLEELRKVPGFIRTTTEGVVFDTLKNAKNFANGSVLENAKKQAIRSRADASGIARQKKNLNPKLFDRIIELAEEGKTSVAKIGTDPKVIKLNNGKKIDYQNIKNIIIREKGEKFFNKVAETKQFAKGTDRIFLEKNLDNLMKDYYKGIGTRNLTDKYLPNSNAAKSLSSSTVLEDVIRENTDPKKLANRPAAIGANQYGTRKEQIKVLKDFQNYLSKNTKKFTSKATAESNLKNLFKGSDSGTIGNFVARTNILRKAYNSKTLPEGFKVNQKVKDLIKNLPVQDFVESELRALGFSEKTIKSMNQVETAVQKMTNASTQLEHALPRSIIRALDLPQKYYLTAERTTNFLNKFKMQFDAQMKNAAMTYAESNQTPSDYKKYISKVNQIRNKVKKLTGGYEIGYVDFDKAGNAIPVTNQASILRKGDAESIKAKGIENFKKNLQYHNNLFKNFSKNPESADFFTLREEISESPRPFVEEFIQKVKSVPGGCRAVVTRALGGPINKCEAIIKADPERAAAKLNNTITATKGPLKDLKEDSQKLIRLFRGEPFKPRNKEAIKALAKRFNVSEAEASKRVLGGQFFSANPDLARGYTGNTFMDNFGRTKYVDLTPKEFQDTKRYVERINKTNDVGGGTRFPVSRRNDGNNIQIMPRRKLKQLEDTGRMKSKMTMFGNVDTPPGTLKYDSVKGGFIDPAEPTKIIDQAQITAWAKENPMPVKVGEEPLKVATNKSVLKNVGKTLATIGAPLPTALIDGYFINQQVKEGKGTAEIASNPLNWLGLATMSTLSDVSGVSKPGKLNAALRLGLNPGVIRGISRFAGLPGLAISTALTAYDQYQKYKDGEGFIFNLLNQKGTE